MKTISPMNHLQICTSEDAISTKKIPPRLTDHELLSSPLQEILLIPLPSGCYLLAEPELPQQAFILTPIPGPPATSPLLMPATCLSAVPGPTAMLHLPLPATGPQALATGPSAPACQRPLSGPTATSPLSLPTTKSLNNNSRLTATSLAASFSSDRSLNY